MEMEKSILISTAHPNFDQKEAMMEYSSKAGELIKKLGGTIVSKHSVTKSILGENPPSFILIAEFPNEETIVTLFESKEYKELIPIREKGFKSVTLYIGK